MCEKNMNLHYGHIKAHSNICHFEIWLICLSKNSKKKLQQKCQEIFIHAGHFNCLKEDTLPNSSWCYRNIWEDGGHRKAHFETTNNCNITCFAPHFVFLSSSFSLSHALTASCHNQHSSCITNSPSGNCSSSDIAPFGWDLMFWITTAVPKSTWSSLQVEMEAPKG